MKNLIKLPDGMDIDVKKISYIKKLVECSVPPFVFGTAWCWYEYEIMLDNGKSILRKSVYWKEGWFSRKVDKENNIKKESSLLNLKKERNELFEKWEKYNVD
jgi:hypothetical protein